MWFALDTMPDSIMALHDVLAAKRDEVMAVWKSLVCGPVTPEGLQTPELFDHMPQFLDQIAEALRGPVTSTSRDEAAASAEGHGQQRLRLGFSLDSVVREYGALRDAIIATAHDAGHVLTFHELQVVFERVVVGIGHAVTEYARQRDAELQRQANEHFAFIAHELRNPLSSVSLAFSRLKVTRQLGGREVEVIERGLHRVANLVDETLQVARTASGIELHRETTTLGALFEDAELGAESAADAKMVTIGIDLQHDASVSVDVRLMRSALGNLVSNAVKYTHEGSTVTVRGSVERGRMVIEVEDCCGGLEPGQVEQAFAPFVRADHEQTGFGLGLAIAKQAVDAHGGAIRVQNLPGKGCMFVLELPIG